MKEQFPVWTLMCDTSEDIGPLGWSADAMLFGRRGVILREIIMSEYVREAVGGTFLPEPDSDELKFMPLRRLPPDSGIIVWGHP